MCLIELWPKIQRIFLQIWFTGITILVLSSGSAATPMYTSQLDKSTIVLGKNEEWSAKVTTMITYRKVGQILVGSAAVRDIFGSEDPAIEELNLLFKCSSLTVTKYEQLLIWSPGNNTNLTFIGKDQCSKGIAFQISSVEQLRFTLRIMRNNMSPQRCLKDSLELQMKIVVKKMNLYSASLFLLNIDPFLRMDIGTNISHNAFHYQPSILSHDAINLLTGNHTFHKKRMKKFKFLSKRFGIIFRRSSLLMKSLFAVTVTLSRVPASLPANVSASCSPHPVAPDVLGVLYSGDEYALAQMKMGRPWISGYINPLNGRLLVQNFFKDILDDKAPNSTLIICITMGLNTAAWDTGVTWKVMEFVHRPVTEINQHVASPVLSGEETCVINYDTTDRSRSHLFLFADFFSIVIASPIVCTRDTYAAVTSHMSALMDGKLCKTHSSRTDIRPKCGRMEIYNGMVLFPDRLDAKLHSGSLTFRKGEASIRFTLTVISMPMLNTQTHWSGLTEVSRIIRLRPSTLRCGVFSAYLTKENFEVFAHFQIDTRRGPVTHEMPMLFAVKHLNLNPNVITTKTIMDDHVRVLEIGFPALDRWRVEDACRVSLICVTRVYRKEALRMGMSNFQSQDYTKLLFTGFPSAIDYINEAENELKLGSCNKFSVKLLAVATSVSFLQLLS